MCIKVPVKQIQVLHLSFSYVSFSNFSRRDDQPFSRKWHWKLIFKAIYRYSQTKITLPFSVIDIINAIIIMTQKDHQFYRHYRRIHRTSHGTVSFPSISLFLLRFVFVPTLYFVLYEPSSHIVQKSVFVLKSHINVCKHFQSTVTMIFVGIQCFKHIPFGYNRLDYNHSTTNTLDGFFVGYQILWFSLRVWSTNSSTYEMVMFFMNYKRKYYGHELWTPWMCHFC